MVTNRIQKALGAIASLGDPVRRRLYEAVAAEEGAVSRNELAKATGVARPLVAYHLDRLVRDGLLAARFERQTGKTGPGAGRPAKLYFRPREPVQVTLPARDYELAAKVLVEAMARSPDAGENVAELAREIGERTAREQLADGSEASDRETLARLLLERGYEPRTEDGRVTWLRNCVFDELAGQQRELVCGMNLALLQGVLQALPDAKMQAKLEPAEGRCCVVLVPADDSRASGQKV